MLAKAYGYAHRGWQIPNTVTTRFALASGTKALTALTVMSLVEQGRLELATPVRSLLGSDLPLIDDRVTVEHLLAHRSGIGDYLDEGAQGVDDYVMCVPVHELDSSESYLAVLLGHRQALPPGDRFAYCNSGYVVLALCAERVGGASFPELVVDRVCRPAGTVDTAFLRADELPGGVASGYLGGADGLRTNVLHLPVLGTGDGGLYSTVADISALWKALFTGALRSAEKVAEMVRPHSAVPEAGSRTGSASGRMPRPRSSCWRAATPGCRFAGCTRRRP